MQNIDERLKDLGVQLPQAPAPAANYIPYYLQQNSLFISGQLPMVNGELLFKGKVSLDVSIEEAVQCAKQCAINIIAQAKAAVGDLNCITQCIKLGIFVACPDTFYQQPIVGNGASNLMVEIFGDKGKHTRFAVGASSLPLNAPVEIDAIFQVEK